ncbi:NlpC/P60 family protein [Dellaglioa sp. BT-FLS60]
MKINSKIAKVMMMTATLVGMNAAVKQVSASDSITDLTSTITKLNSKSTKVTAKLATINSEITSTKAEVKSAKDSAAKLEADQYNLGKKISRLNVEITQRDSQLANQTRALQVDGSTTSMVQFVSDSKNVVDAFKRVGTVTTLVSAGQKAAKQQKEAKAEVKSDKVQLDKKAVAQEKTVKEYTNKQADLAVKQANANTLKAQIDSKKSDAQSSIDKAKEAEAAAEKAAAETKAANAKNDAAAADAAAAKATKAATSSNDTSKSNSSDTSSSKSNSNDTKSSPASSNKSTANNVSSNNASSNNASSSNTSSSPVSSSKPSSSNSSSVSASSLDTSSITALARSLTTKGIPYVWGGKSLSGFDCSGFTSYVYAHAAGKSIGGYTVAQEGNVTYESVSQAQPGDLLFWGSKGASYHVAIYLGGSQFAEAPTEGQNVKISTMNAYWKPSFAGRVK